MHLFDGLGQLQVYGSGDGSDGPGGKPDYSKPLPSINLEEIAPVLDIAINGSSIKGQTVTCSQCKATFEMKDSKGNGVVTNKPSKDTMNLEQ